MVIYPVAEIACHSGIIWKFTQVFESRRVHSLIGIQEHDPGSRQFAQAFTTRILQTETAISLQRYLQGLDSESAQLHGVTEGERLSVPIREVDYLWTGDAYVIWETFEEIPDVLALGHRGEGVMWLQHALAQLGYHGREPSGVFDRSTEESVMSLQTGALIEPDGAVGPQTQMVLYNLLERYQVPRLRVLEGEG